MELRPNVARIDGARGCGAYQFKVLREKWPGRPERDPPARRSLWTEVGFHEGSILRTVAGFFRLAQVGRSGEQDDYELVARLRSARTAHRFTAAAVGLGRGPVGNFAHGQQHPSNAARTHSKSALGCRGREDRGFRACPCESEGSCFRQIALMTG